MTVRKVQRHLDVRTISRPLAVKTVMPGPRGAVGPKGDKGDPGVQVGIVIGSTPPLDTSLLWIDTAEAVIGV